MEEGLTPDDAEKIFKTYLQLSKLFSEYVRESDPELWKRAVDYAKTFTNVDGVTLYYEDDDKNEY